MILLSFKKIALYRIFSFIDETILLREDFEVLARGVAPVLRRPKALTRKVANLREDL